MHANICSTLALHANPLYTAAQAMVILFKAELGACDSIVPLACVGRLASGHTRVGMAGQVAFRL
jgi:hypothetical protein